MPKVLAFVLLLVLGLPSALPLYAAGLAQGDAGVPACCRRAGQHHCAMQGETGGRVSPAQGARAMRSAVEACPYRCALLTRTHVDLSDAGAASLRLYAAVVAHPAVQARTASRWRVARERSRGKRGPPSVDGSVRPLVG